LLSLSLPLSFFLSLFLSHTHSLSHTDTHTHSLSLALSSSSLSFSSSLSRSLSLARCLSIHTLGADVRHGYLLTPLILQVSLFLTHTLSRKRALSLTHTLSLSLFLSLSLSLSHSLSLFYSLSLGVSLSANPGLMYAKATFEPTGSFKNPLDPSRTHWILQEPTGSFKNPLDPSRTHWILQVSLSLSLARSLFLSLSVNRGLVYDKDTFKPTDPFKLVAACILALSRSVGAYHSGETGLDFTPKFTHMYQNPETST